MTVGWRDIEASARAVVSQARDKGITLASAESCTGGGIGAAITEISGASAVYPGGIIAYSNRVKMDRLGVPKDSIMTHGAVSAQTATAMAEGAVKLFDTDFAVAVTGIAGPSGGSAEKPVGLVYIAAAEKSGNIWVKDFRFGDAGRSQVRLNTIFEALALLGEKIQ